MHRLPPLARFVGPALCLAGASAAAAAAANANVATCSAGLEQDSLQASVESGSANNLHLLQMEGKRRSKYSVCPGSGAHCEGKQCCPGTQSTGWMSFACPGEWQQWNCDCMVKPPGCGAPPQTPQTQTTSQQPTTSPTQTSQQPTTSPTQTSQQPTTSDPPQEPTTSSNQGEGKVKCIGSIEVRGLGPVQVVMPKRSPPDSVSIEDGKLVLQRDAVAYLATRCQRGSDGDWVSNEDYLALDVLNKMFYYDFEMMNSGCGCCATMYLTSMRQNTRVSNTANPEDGCQDYYCDANPHKTCGLKCEEINIQEMSLYGWYSVYHTEDDPNGQSHGFGGGGESWTGPRDWKQGQWSPGSSVIDTSKAVTIIATFPMDQSKQRFRGMQVDITQGDSTPKRRVSTGLMSDYSKNSYKAYTLHEPNSEIDGLNIMKQALQTGMTPVFTYWTSHDMEWLDGAGSDGQGGGCSYPTPSPGMECQADSKAVYSNFGLHDMR